MAPKFDAPATVAGSRAEDPLRNLNGTCDGPLAVQIPSSRFSRREDGVTIAGAGAWEAATQAGIARAAVIETDGDTLVVVKRKGR